MDILLAIADLVFQHSNGERPPFSFTPEQETEETKALI